MLHLPSYSLHYGLLGRVPVSRMVVHQWVLLLRPPAKKAGSKHAGNAVATPAHKTHRTFNLPSLNLPRVLEFLASLTSQELAGYRTSIMKPFLMLKVERCYSTHMWHLQESQCLHQVGASTERLVKNDSQFFT